MGPPVTAQHACPGKAAPQRGVMRPGACRKRSPVRPAQDPASPVPRQVKNGLTVAAIGRKAAPDPPKSGENTARWRGGCFHFCAYTSAIPGFGRAIAPYWPSYGNKNHNTARRPARARAPQFRRKGLVPRRHQSRRDVPTIYVLHPRRGGRRIGPTARWGRLHRENPGARGGNRTHTPCGGGF